MPRYIQVPYSPDQYVRWEVLEAFTSGPTRSFNLRRRGGMGNCEGAEIIRTLEQEFGIKDMIGEVNSMAGDINVTFKPAPLPMSVVDSRPAPAKVRKGGSRD
jgi:hypothetical protein